MIKLVLGVIKGFFVSNKSNLLLSLALLFSIWFSYKSGLNNGKAIAKQEYTTYQAKQATEILTQFINQTKTVIQIANEASTVLSQQITERKLYDEQSTKLLQDAVDTTSNRRADCVFDTTILQYIDAARARAVTATTSGITGSTSSSMRTTSETLK